MHRHNAATVLFVLLFNDPEKKQANKYDCAHSAECAQQRSKSPKYLSHFRSLL